MSSKDKALKRVSIVGGLPVKGWGKVIKSIKKTGHYESPESKKSQKVSDKKWATYIKERSARYKREGITE